MDNAKLSTTICRLRNAQVDKTLIRSIVREYSEYPQYVIKYISVYYPEEFSRCVVDHIIESNERRCELIECILSSYSIKMCDNPYISDFVCVNVCRCYVRDCWKHIYKLFLEEITKAPNYFFQSFNVYSSFTSLISKTDVLDDDLFNFVSNVSRNPKNWRYVIKFIKDAELFSSKYGDVIFMMRDLILDNDKLDDAKKNKYISEFQNRALLGSLLHSYNTYQKSIAKITDNIYISDITVAKNVSMLRDKKIHCVVTLTKKTVFRVSNIEYTQIMIDDVGSVDFLGATLRSVDKVNEWIRKKKIVLVHCYKGLSRSVCFVILVLVHQGMTFQQAYDLIAEKKDSIDPNPEFIRQIIEYCEHKFSKTS